MLSFPMRCLYGSLLCCLCIYGSSLSEKIDSGYEGRIISHKRHNSQIFSSFLHYLFSPPFRLLDKPLFVLKDLNSPFYMGFYLRDNKYGSNIYFVRIFSHVRMEFPVGYYQSYQSKTHFAIGTSLGMNLRHSKGLGGFIHYRNTTLSMESRLVFATRIFNKNQNSFEFLLFVPFFSQGLFGYQKTQGENIFANFRFLVNFDKFRL